VPRVAGVRCDAGAVEHFLRVKTEDGMRAGKFVKE